MFEMLINIIQRKAYHKKIIEVEQTLMGKPNENVENGLLKKSLEANGLQIFQFNDEIISY